ncbi:uncharacterized protein LOC113027479 [Astatotilapia calliptera]|uniref:uncharacterized protein LOC113027479 n=1 Tax=Astatotilapia calliptera TaxID=8154 RepID=UPI000E402D00|nr:uncharacterized protein LOC113027479 [Astatotilapia calliptera]
MCLTYISQRQLINSCPSLSVAEIQEQWPFLFTQKGLSNHFYKLTGIDISERLGQALITKGRRIVNYFSTQKLRLNLGIRTLIQQIESEGVLTNNKVGTAAILLMMKYYKEDEDSLFVLADETSTRMSLEAESNLPGTPRLIMLDDPWPMLSGHLHKTNNNEDKLSCHLARRCLCPIGFLSATVLIFFPSFTCLLKIISATYTFIVTRIGSPYKSMNSVHKARSGFSAGQSSSFTPHTIIHVLVDLALYIDLVV